MNKTLEAHLNFILLQVYCLGTLLSMQISFVGFQPVQSSEHMAVSNVLSDIMAHLQWFVMRKI